mmetsp:Transcript_45545/g.118014  ORF Transcript_45545/g.118014 Transcript_45545/m.118014 type:complete len:332 (-) Transcript_45545:347-1342(-)
MGCLSSKLRGRKYEAPLAKQNDQQYSWQKGERPDPKDYMYVGLKGEVKIREPGSINGQQFVLDRCEDCDIYLFDTMAQVTIDDCVNCRIFVGPVVGSYFIRDCTGCKCTIICRQFRSRDCHDCDTLMLCSTRPIVESSTNMRFGCYDLPYRGLHGHLKSVQMNFLQNHWSHIYDFTPKDGNWSYLPPTASSQEGLTALEESEAASNPTVDDAPLITWGERPLQSKTFHWVLFPPAAAGAALPFARNACVKARMLRTNTVTLTKEQAQAVVAKAGWDGGKLVKELCSGASVGVEFGGSQGMEEVTEMAQSAGALLTESVDAAAEYRYLGVEG